MDIPRYRTCFVCGWDNERGLKLTFRTEGDDVLTDFTPEENLCGWSGVVHGGIVTAVLDECMGWTGFPESGDSFLTAEVKVRFIRPVKSGETYTVRAKKQKQRGRFYTATGEMTDKEGTVVAAGEGRFFLVEGEVLGGDSR